MKVYTLEGEYLKCPGCNWDCGRLYYIDEEDAKKDIDLIKQGLRPEIGLCPHCFLNIEADLEILEVEVE